ncbi:MAG: pilus assembly protein [Actinobacteria bacterium]|nr:pilus assembly protein [Actinomycetota bacterium]
MNRFRIRGQGGAAAVEFAIIASLLIVLVFGIIVYGLAFSKLEVLNAAAREGARYAAVRCEPDASSGCTNQLIEDRVKAAAVPYQNQLTNDPAADRVCTDATSGQAVTVSWTQSIPINIPLLPAFTYTKTIKGVFRCE